jgi:hypothetical protein
MSDSTTEKEQQMRLLSVMAGAALIASCGLANAQATNFSPTPGDAMTLGNSDVRDYRSEAKRRAMESRHWHQHQHRGWNSYGAGWNGAGVQIGPLGFGIGYEPWRHDQYGYGAYGPRVRDRDGWY